MSTSFHRITSAAICAIALLGASQSHLRADDVAPAASENQSTQSSPAAKVPALTIERDAATGQAQMFLVHPDGRKQPIQNLPPGAPLAGPVMPAEVADYIDAIRTLAVGERYIIGVELKPIPDGLHKRLGLKENCGLLVASVIEGKPADQAGVHQHDILTMIDHKPVCHPADVVRMVNKAKDQPITLTIIRDSEPFELKVTPCKAMLDELPASQQFGVIGGEMAEALPPSVRIVGPGMIVSGARAEEIKALREEIQSLQKELHDLQQVVKDLQSQLPKTSE